MLCARHRQLIYRKNGFQGSPQKVTSLAKLARHELHRRGNRRIIEKLGNVVSLQTSKQSSQKFKSPTEETPARGPPTTLRALHHRSFPLFFAAQLVSLIASCMQSSRQSR